MRKLITNVHMYLTEMIIENCEDCERKVFEDEVRSAVTS